MTIHIDGSLGEGGGQILRSALALSIATGQPFRITNIRARRAKPGLMRQHLMCVQAAAAISRAEVTGAHIGSQEVAFAPAGIFGGDYHFPIGTAGGTMLVLQAILPPLLLADTSSRICIEGGTHNRAAPPFDFFERALLPLLSRAGARVQVGLERHGFYPAGGGRVIVQVEPTLTPCPIEIASRGNRVSQHATAIVSRLSPSIAERELNVLRHRLSLAEHEIQIVEVRDPVGPGNGVIVELCYEHVTEVFSGIGEIGTAAEHVARTVAENVRDYIAAQHPIGPHLADQLMAPLAVLAGGRYATGDLTEHSLTNIATLKEFGIEVAVDQNGVINVPTFRKNS